MQPLVTVIIPCFNYGRFLSDALDSIRAQAYEAWECLVVDDGSTDNTREVVTRYAQQDARFRYLFQSNSGVSSARNTALKAANGTYIQLLDADDLIEKAKLKLQVAFLEENTKVDLVYSNIIFFKDAERTCISAPKLLHDKIGVSGSGEALLYALLEDNIFLPGCVLFRKSLYEDVGRFRKGIEGIEDWDYFYRSALAHKTFYYDKREGTCLLSRSHGTNASNNGFVMLSNKIKARTLLLLETKKLVANNDTCFSKGFIKKACTIHLALLNRDKARLNLYYGSMFAGCVQAVKHAFYSQKPYYALYDSAYWIKERIKKSLKK